MPSASSKSEKPASSEVVDPLKQIIVIVEHKTRNLEKRKTRLESYKVNRKSLTKEQVEALSKYDEVVGQLYLSKEYAKQFNAISTENEKSKKKQAKKESVERHASDVNRVRQILLIQDILQHMGTEKVQGDFLAGTNGAVQLTDKDLKFLDDLYTELSPKRFTEDGAPFPKDQFQRAAEYFMAIVEGRTNKLVGTTCAKLSELVTSIIACGYFDKPLPEDSPVPVQKEEEFHDAQEIPADVVTPNQNHSEGVVPPPQKSAPLQQMMSSAPVIPSGGQQPQPPIRPTNQPQMMPPNVTNIVPTPVSQVESTFFNAQGFKPPAPQSTAPPPASNTRQINDVIQSVTGKFNFLQDSELEIPEINPVGAANPPVQNQQVAGSSPPALSARTFTNQNFNGQPTTASSYPPNYPTQTTAFQNFVPGYSGFVAQNSSSAPNNPTNTNASTNNSKIATPIPMPPNRNSNIGYNQSQQQLSSTGFSSQQSSQQGSQPSNQLTNFQHGSLNMTQQNKTATEETVRSESEKKEKQDTDYKTWKQPETGNWADDLGDTNEWNPQPTSPQEGSNNQNKFSSGRSNRNDRGMGGGSRNANGYPGNRNRNPRPSGGYRDPQNNSGGGGNNYYQNQNGYQPRNERNNDYSGSGKGTSDFRDNTYNNRGDFSNRDKESRDGYGMGGGFKRGPTNRGPTNRGPYVPNKGPMDRGDRQGQAPRNNPGGPRPSRGMPRVGGGNAANYPRQPPNQGVHLSNISK